MSQIDTAISPIIENFQSKLMLDSNLISFQNGLPNPVCPSTTTHESLIDKIKKKIENKETWFSLEFFPPKTVNGASNLISKLEFLGTGKPLFCDITWHPAGDPASDKPTSSMKISNVMLNYCLLETMLHITCYGQTKESMKQYLDKAKSIGIRNLLALRGDPAVGTEWRYQENGFNYATDLVRFIRENYGILPIQSYDSLRHICKLSKLEVPQNIVSAMEKIKDNDEAIRIYGIEQAVNLCQELMQAGVFGVHFYTLNRDVAVTEILRRLDLWNKDSEPRHLPWKSKQLCSYSRPDEDVRPIFWSIRPKSYVCRTSDWDQFPNGRWGNSSAPSFGDLKDYHIFYSKINTKECLAQWGHNLNDETDVWNVFASFVSGKPNKIGVKITSFPWCEEGLASETSLLTDELERFNRQGILTINSQPNVNGAPSSDPVIGWGSPDGYVYQKAYIEFFISKSFLPFLLEALEKYPRVIYHIINKSGDINLTNCTLLNPNAVTWGVFPGKEIVQPTVVDPISFMSWKDESFNIWTDYWGKLYEPNSTSRELLEQISNTYLLVNIVDNEFQKENCIWSILNEMLELKAKNMLKISLKLA
ncbi:methylenetetrahydrofolate reductase isoform X2 [Brachionus plicatilis]|uniref:Methylenetetrahydrofolate reductase isoform X2 n=1 Tax=Brachionus plicatilis TaxID=10195 RepID=A0A3M7STU8_BRAPC|nr:methylenetetrahydrofolate reductase isoform X2 [Brachionus plicatilis]